MVAPTPGQHDGGADGGAEGPADGGATPVARRWRRRWRGGSGRWWCDPGSAGRWRRRWRGGPADGGATRVSRTAAPTAAPGSGHMTHLDPAGRPRPPGGSVRTRRRGAGPLRLGRTGQVRRRALGSHPAAVPRRRAARPVGFTDLLSPADADELLEPARSAYPVPAGGQGRPVGAGGALDRWRRRGRRDRRPGARRAGPGAVRRRRDAGVAGPAPDLAAARRLRPRPGPRADQPLQINAYLTPPGSQGFATHYDTHDVFVLQVDGRNTGGSTRPC